MKIEDLKKRCASRAGAVINGRWKLERFVGLQKIFSVYMSRDDQGTLGVVRVMHPEVCTNQQHRAEFIREVYIDSALNHDGLIKVLDSGSDDNGAPYLVREVVQGETVKAWLERSEGHLPVPQALSVVEQVLRLLDVAHRNQIIHGNLSPANLYRVREGTIKVMNFGVPPKGGAFMAPEQVPNSTAKTGPRTDLWGAGSLLMTLLSGKGPYRGDRDPVTSVRGIPGIRGLSDVLSGSPECLETLLVRALGVAPEERFKNAPEFLAALDECRAMVAVMDLSSVLPSEMVASQSGNMDGTLDFDSTGYTKVVLTNLKAIFMQVESCIDSRRLSGLNHPDTKACFQKAFESVAYALDDHDGTLFWSISPYSILGGDETVWEPNSPNDAICYALFADGIRAMGFNQGLKETEFMDWLAMMTMDPFEDLPLDDDLVSYLWDADFGEVVFQLNDGNRSRTVSEWVEKETFNQGFVKQARRPLRSGVVEAWLGWQAVRKEENRETRKRAQNLWGTLKGVGDNEERVKAATQELETVWSAGGQLDFSLVDLAPAERSALARAFEKEASHLDGYFARVCGESFMHARDEESRAWVTTGLKGALKELALEDPDLALELVLHITEHLPPDDKAADVSFRRNLMEAILEPDYTRVIFEHLAELRQAEREIYFERLVTMTSMMPTSMVPTVLKIIETVSETRLRHVLLDYLKREGAGAEDAMSTLFAVLGETEGLALAEILADFGTEAGQEAIGKGVTSPHPLVRVQALEHLDESSGMRVREELRTLLEDENETVRIAALDAIMKYQIKAAGPYLVLRIRQPDFFDYSSEERQKSLETIATLRPDRAERICVEILVNTGEIRSDNLDETRVQATKVLMDVAHSKVAFEALKRTALGHERRTSDKLRTAAAEALNQITMKIRNRQAQKGKVQANREEEV